MSSALGFRLQQLAAVALHPALDEENAPPNVDGAAAAKEPSLPSQMATAADANGRAAICALSASRVALVRAASLTEDVSASDAVSRVSELGSVAECCAWNADASCAVVGDRSGKIHFFSSSGTLLFSQQLAGPSEEGGPTFASIAFCAPPALAYEADREVLHVVGARGSVTRITNFPFARLAAAAASGDAALLQQMRSAMSVSTCDLGEIHTSAVTAFVPVWRPWGFEVFAAGLGRYALSFWKGVGDGPLEPQQAVEERAVGGRVKTLLTAGSDFLLVLTEDGAASCWDARSLFPLATWASTPVTSIAALPDAASSGAVRFAAAVPGAVIVFAFANGGELEPVFRTPTGDDPARVYASTPSDGVPPFFMLAQLQVSKGPAVAVSVCHQALPLFQLQRLVEAGEFEDALALASQHGLSEELVRRPQLMALLAGIEEEGASPDALQRLAALLPVADSALVKAVIRCRVPTAAGTQRLLNGLKEACGTSDTAVLADEALWAWVSFQLVSDPSAEFSAERWQAFRRSGAEELLAPRVKAGSIRAVITLWARHVAADHVSGQSRKRVFDNIARLLERLPLDVPPSTYVPWLREEVAPLLSSKQRHGFETWLEKRAVALEHLTGTPAQSLELCSVVCGVSSASPATTTGLASLKSPGALLQRQLLAPGGVGEILAHDRSPLFQLHADLRELSHLRHTHNMHLSLFDYQQPTTTVESIAGEMLDRVSAPELLQDEIRCHVAPWARRHGFTLDTFLWVYVVDLSDSTSLTSAAQQARAITVARAISDVGMRVRTALVILRAAAPPFAPELLAFLSDAQRWQCGDKLMAELTEHQRLMNLQRVLLRYNVRHFNVSDVRQAKALLSHVLAQVDSSEALRDGLLIAGAYSQFCALDTYVLFLENLASTLPPVPNCATTVQETLSALTPAEAVTVGQEVLVFCFDVLEEMNEAFNAPEEEGGGSLAEDQLAEAGLALLVADAVLQATVPLRLGEGGPSLIPTRPDRPVAHLCTAGTGDVVRRLRLLLQDFGVVLAPAALRQPTQTRAVLQRLLVEEKKAEGKEEEKKETSPRMRRAAGLLGVPEAELNGMLAKAAARSGDILRAVDLAEQLRRSGAPRAPMHVRDTAVAMVSFVGSNPEIFEGKVTAETKVQGRAAAYALQLLQWYCSDCSDADLSAAVSLLPGANVVAMALAQSELGSYADLWLTEGEESLCLVGRGQHQLAHRLHPAWFSGDSAVLGTADAMHRVTRFVHLLQQGQGASAVTELVEYLSSNGAHQLACSALACVSEPEQEEQEAQLGGLLKRILVSQTIDAELALAAMLSSPQRTALKTFRQVLPTVTGDFERLQQLARLGRDAAILWEQDAVRTMCEQLEGNARWWEELAALSIEFDHAAFFFSDGDEVNVDYVQGLVPALLQRTEYDLDRCLNFAASFRLEASFVGILCVEGLLLRPPETCWNYQERIRAALAIVDRGQLETLLLAALPRLDGRDYDRLQFVCDLLGDLADDEAEVTKFAHQSRAAELLRDIAADDVALSLDFHLLLADPWAVLSELLNTTTIVRLVALSEPLGTDPDVFYAKLVSRLSEAAEEAGEGEGDVLPFSELEPHLKCIRDAQLAIDTSIHVAGIYPVCQNKLLALQTALSIAERWEGAEENLMEKLQERVRLLQMQLLLRSLGPEGAALETHLADPATLVKQVYATFSLQAAQASSADAARNVHRVAEEMCQLHGIDAERVRRHLAHEWLCEDLSVPTRSSQSSCFVPTAAEKDEEAQREQTLRVAFVLSFTDEPDEEEGEREAPSMADRCSFLLGYAHTTRSTKISLRSRLRALQACFALAPLATIESAYGKDVGQLRDYWQQLSYMVRFEALRIPQAIEQLDAEHVEAVVRGLWRDRAHDGPLVLLVAHLMLDCQMEDCQLWLAVLDRLLELGLYRDLLGLLAPLSAVSALRVHRERLVPLWSAVLMRPLTEVADKVKREAAAGAQASLSQSLLFQAQPQKATEEDPEAEVDAVLEQVVLLLHRCPFVLDIDVPSYVVAFRDMGPRYHRLAVRAALGIPNAAMRAASVVHVLQAGVFLPVLDVVVAAATATSHREASPDEADGDDGDVSLVQFAYDAVDAAGAHAQLLGTPYLAGFVEYLVAAGRVDNIVRITAEAGRVAQCAALIRDFRAAHPEDEASVQCAGLTDDAELVEAFQEGRKEGV